MQINAQSTSVPQPFVSVQQFTYHRLAIHTSKILLPGFVSKLTYTRMDSVIYIFIVHSLDIKSLGQAVEQVAFTSHLHFAQRFVSWMYLCCVPMYVYNVRK